jgi:hypothetical protein
MSPVKRVSGLPRGPSSCGLPGRQKRRRGCDQRRAELGERLGAEVTAAEIVCSLGFLLLTTLCAPGRGNAGAKRIPQDGAKNRGGRFSTEQAP